IPVDCVLLQYFAGHTARICCVARGAVCFLLDGWPGILAEEERKASTAVLLAFVFLLHEFRPASWIAQISKRSPNSHLEANAPSNTACDALGNRARQSRKSGREVVQSVGH